MSTNGVDDDHNNPYALDSPVASPSSDDSSDNNMQVDSDVDVRQTPDIDADGELDEGTDSDIDPHPAHISHSAAASSSYTTKRVVRAQPTLLSPLFTHCSCLYTYRSKTKRTR